MNRRSFLAKTPALAIAAALGLTLRAPLPVNRWAGWHWRTEGIPGHEDLADIWLLDPHDRRRWHTTGVTWDAVRDPVMFEDILTNMKRQFLEFGNS